MVTSTVLSIGTSLNADLPPVKQGETETPAEIVLDARLEIRDRVMVVDRVYPAPDVDDDIGCIPGTPSAAAGRR
jgi:hypothetical protein